MLNENKLDNRNNIFNIETYIKLIIVFIFTFIPIHVILAFGILSPISIGVLIGIGLLVITILFLTLVISKSNSVYNLLKRLRSSKGSQ